MRLNELNQLVGSTGFPNRIMTSLGIRSDIYDETQRSMLPLRFRKLIDQARVLLALQDDDTVFVYSSPGRLMYTGNHAEKWKGLSLGAAVNPDILAILRPRDDSQVVLYSSGYEHPVHVDTTDISPREEEKGSSAAFIRGAAAELTSHSLPVNGFDCYIHSQILPGGGLNASCSFASLMLYCLSGSRTEAKSARNEHVLTADPIHSAEMVCRIESQYFGDQCDLSAPAIIFSGGLQLCDYEDGLSISRIEQNAAMFSHRQYIVDSLNTAHDAESVYNHLQEELKRIHVIRDEDLLNPETYSGYSQEDMVLAHFFQSEAVRIKKIVHALRSGNSDRMLYMFQEYLHEYRHVIHMIHRKMNGVNDKLALLHSILSMYKTRDNVTLVHGPFGEGIDSKAFFMICNDKAVEFENILEEFFDYLNILPVFPREQGCIRLL